MLYIDKEYLENLESNYKKLDSNENSLYRELDNDIIELLLKYSKSAVLTRMNVGKINTLRFLLEDIILNTNKYINYED